MTVGEIISLVVTTAGGTGVLVVGFGAWLGKVWASRITEADKARHASEVERLKSELELSRSQKNRISEAQFQLFTEVWSNLQDLHTMGQRLWERASEHNVIAFAAALQNARVAANRGRLILPEQHFETLARLFSVFDNYRIGKLRLIEFRTREEMEEHYSYDSEDRIREQIRSNGDAKSEYEHLLDQIVVNFRQELGLAA